MNQSKMNLAEANGGKTVAILAYLTVFGLIAALVMNNNQKTNLGRFHIRQSIGLTIFALLLGVLTFLPVVGKIISPVLGILVLIALVLGILGAINKQEKELPLVGGFFQKWLTMI